MAENGGQVFHTRVMTDCGKSGNSDKPAISKTYSTVTDLARFLGLSTSVPFCKAT